MEICKLYIISTTKSASLFIDTQLKWLQLYNESSLIVLTLIEVKSSETALWNMENHQQNSHLVLIAAPTLLVTLPPTTIKCWKIEPV